MRSKTLILMVVAIGCGLAASLMVKQAIADKNQKEEVEKVIVLVARQNIPMATLLKEPEKWFEEKQFTKGEEPKKAIRDFKELVEKRLNKPLSAEAFVTPDDLAGKDNSGLSSVIRPGMRAVALKVQADSAVGGFVLPQSRVDIVSVVRRGDNDTHSKIIMQNVLVLAVDTMDRKPDDKTAVVVSTITVEVTPQQAEKLALASELGTLRMNLRGFDDQQTVTTTGVTPRQIASGTDSTKPDEPVSDVNDSPRRIPLPLASIPEVPPTASAVETTPEPPPPPKTFTQTIFNGENRTTAVFTENQEEPQIERSQPSSGKSAPRPSPTKP